MAGEPAFFEIGVDDPERGKAFYGALFDWDFAPGPSGEGGFLIGTSGVQGGLHGGDPGAVPYVFFRMDDMDAALTKVRELGGTVDDADLGNEGRRPIRSLQALQGRPRISIRPVRAARHQGCSTWRVGGSRREQLCPWSTGTS